MLRTNCRAQFTADDFQFIIHTLSKAPSQAVALTDLLTDDEMRDSVIDDDLIYQTLIDSERWLAVSPHFYFYILVRRVLLWAGLDDRSVADYLASVLVEYGRRSAAGDPSTGSNLFTQFYLSDLMVMLKDANPWQRLEIRSHIGDTAIFISGIFIDRVNAIRDRRGGPSIRFYDQMGQSSYFEASCDRLIHETDQGPVFDVLGREYIKVRKALNHLSDSVLHLSQDRFPLLPS
ncbi:MAG: hypothetical protein AAFY98_09675 [Verrucomicrobiota bacterium]